MGGDQQLDKGEQNQCSHEQKGRTKQKNPLQYCCLRLFGGWYSRGQRAYITERRASLFPLLVEQLIFNCYTRVIWPKSSSLWQLRKSAHLSTFNQLTLLCKAEPFRSSSGLTPLLLIYCLKPLNQEAGVQKGKAVHIHCLVSVTACYCQLSV